MQAAQKGFSGEAVVVLVSVKNVIENSERTRTRTHEHDSSEAIERAT